MTSPKFFPIATLALSPLSVEAATTWNAASDFYANEISAESKPTGDWRYGYRDTVVSAAISLFSGADHSDSVNGIPNLGGWFLTGSGSLITAVTTSNVGTLSPGTLIVHPQEFSSNPTYNVIRWTAPSNGTYDLSFSWQLIDNTSDGVDVHVISNGVTPLYTNPSVTPGPGAGSSFSGLVLTSGQTIDFVVGPGINASSDSTIFNATITLVPEPSSALLAVASLPLFFLRRRDS